MRGASPVLPKCMVDGTKAIVSTSPSFSISPSLHFHTGLVVEIILVNDHQLCAYWAGLPASPFCLQPSHAQLGAAGRGKACLKWSGRRLSSAGAY